MCFFLNLFAPWQETFADARDGDGVGLGWWVGSVGDHLGPKMEHFKTPTKYVFQPKNDFLEMAHTIFSPLFAWQHISPWFTPKITQFNNLTFRKQKLQQNNKSNFVLQKLYFLNMFIYFYILEELPGWSKGPCIGHIPPPRLWNDSEKARAAPTRELLHTRSRVT